VRVFSLVALIILVVVVGYLALHEPLPRGAFDSFAAFNVEAMISAANGTAVAAVAYVVVRTVLYLVIGVALNLVRLQWRRAALLVIVLALKLALAWGIYLALFSYSREVGFTRILWNLQDLGMDTDAFAVVAVSAINIACIALIPDLVVGLLSDKHEVGLIRVGWRQDYDHDKDGEA
jgi:hypothetical protein